MFAVMAGWPGHYLHKCCGACVRAFVRASWRCCGGELREMIRAARWRQRRRRRNGLNACVLCMRLDGWSCACSECRFNRHVTNANLCGLKMVLRNELTLSLSGALHRCAGGEKGGVYCGGNTEECTEEFMLVPFLLAML